MSSLQSPSDRKVGDRIRIIAIPGSGIPGYFLHPDTRRVFRKLIARRRSVRIERIDSFGSPWYRCRFQKRDGRWEEHSLSVAEGDHNWVRVIPRRRKSV